MNIKSRKGFSIIELLIVIAIMAIMATVAVPNFNKYRYNYKLKEIARKMSGEIQFYKQRTVSENVRYLLYFPYWSDLTTYSVWKNCPAGGWCWIKQGNDKKIGDDDLVIISGAPDFLNNPPNDWHASYIIFDPRGTAGSGSLILKHKKQISTANITTTMMGRVSVKYDLK